MLADYTSPGAVVILSRRTGRLLWRYRVTSGPGMLDHPSLAAMLPNGMIALNDDFNERVVIIDPRTNKIVWTVRAPRPSRQGARIPQHARRVPVHPGDRVGTA